jgi:hypothetical protein
MIPKGYRTAGIPAHRDDERLSLGVHQFRVLATTAVAALLVGDRQAILDDPVGKFSDMMVGHHQRTC